MNIADLLKPEHVVTGLPAVGKAQLFADLARRAAAATGVSQTLIQKALTAREGLGSTGVGAGVAIPHARVPGVARFFGMFARLDRRLDYDAVDEQPVDLVFLLLAPQAANEHLQALASISRRLRDPSVAARLRKLNSIPALYTVLAGDDGH